MTVPVISLPQLLILLGRVVLSQFSTSRRQADIPTMTTVDLLSCHQATLTALEQIFRADSSTKFEDRNLSVTTHRGPVHRVASKVAFFDRVSTPKDIRMSQGKYRQYYI